MSKRDTQALIDEARGFTAGSSPDNARSSLINDLADALDDMIARFNRLDAALLEEVDECERLGHIIYRLMGSPRGLTLEATIARAEEMTAVFPVPFSVELPTIRNTIQ